MSSGRHFTQRCAVEKTVLEHSTEHIGTKTDTAKRPRTDHDTGCKLAEYRGQLQHRGNRATELGGEDDDADLQNEKHHLFGAG